MLRVVFSRAITHIMEKLTAWLNAERGRRVSLAKALEITPGAISQWNEVPIERAIAISNFTGIPRAELRGDYWG